MGADLRIAVSGYYGCGNTGDEAVLAGIIQSFSERGGIGPEAFTVLSQRPDDTQRRHGVRAVYRMSHADVRQALRESDILLSGGGSLLQDTTSLRSLFYYLWIIRIALSIRLPVMAYAQGIGPLRRAVSRTAVRTVLNRVHRITVRDPESAEVLKQIGVKRPPVDVTADPAFALSAVSEERAMEILADAGAPSDGALIGFALRPWPLTMGANPDAYVQLAAAILDNTGGHIVFLPMQPPGDVELSNAVAGKLGKRASVVRCEMSPNEALAVTAKLTGLVAMRLHALIFGAMSAIPIVALSYDPKVAQFMERLGQQDRSFELGSLHTGDIVDALAYTFSARDNVREDLRRLSTDLRDLALLNVDRAFAVARK